MAEVENRLSDVFGVSRDVPKTYIDRPYVDDRFLNSLARDKHLVVYGSSKQGKTCLRKRCLQPSDYITVQCANNGTVAQIYASIFKEAGATVNLTETLTTSGERKLAVQLEVEGKIPLVSKGSLSGEGEFTTGNERVTTKQTFEIDPSDPNDVIRVLSDANFTKFIVLEDFHYLSEEVQKRIAIDLKAFHEKSKLCFIVVGVWLESNRLVLYNGDLAGRLIPIDADRWEDAELTKLLEAGEALLNLRFSERVKTHLTNATQKNVGLLQEACYRLCEKTGVTKTCQSTLEIDDISSIDEIVRELGTEQAGRYQNFIAKFVEGFQKTELEMYRWLMHAIVTSAPDELRKGVKAVALHRKLQASHPQGQRLLYNNVLQALGNVAKLQHQNRVQPIVLDFDANEAVLRIVDSGFLIYLAAESRDVLLALCGTQN